MRRAHGAVAVRRRLLCLCGRGAHGVPGGAAHGATGSSAPDPARDGASRPGDQEPPGAAVGGRHAPRRLRHGGGRRGRHYGHAGWNTDQYLLYRAAQRHVPRRARTLDPAWPTPSPRCSLADQRDVVGRHDLQLLLAPREPPPPCPRGTKVAEAHPGYGGRPDRPPLDHGGAAALPRPPRDGCARAAPDS